MRAQAMGEADLVVTVGRRLDFQLAYGSPAVFANAQFVRISDIAGELGDNRRGIVEILADCGSAIQAIADIASAWDSAQDRTWLASLRARHLVRVSTHRL